MNSTNFLKRQNLWSAILLIIMMMMVSSCDDQSDDQIYDNLIGQTWVGDLGFTVDEFPVESGITFSGNDYAIDEQYYFGGDRAATLTLRWWIEGQSLWLDYGYGYPILEIRKIRVGNLFLHGSIYADGYYDGEIELERMTNR